MRTWTPCGWYGWQWQGAGTGLIHRPDCERAAKAGQVPRWTSEDEANLARRVRRIAAKRKP